MARYRWTLKNCNQVGCLLTKINWSGFSPRDIKSRWEIFFVKIIIFFRIIKKVSHKKKVSQSFGYLTIVNKTWEFCWIYLYHDGKRVKDWIFNFFPFCQIILAISKCVIYVNCKALTVQKMWVFIKYDEPEINFS